MSAYSVIKRENAVEIAFFDNKPIDLSERPHGIEILVRGKWRPLKRLFGSVRRFATAYDACWAAAAAQENRGRPARIFPIASAK